MGAKKDRRRADEILVGAGLAADRREAGALIMAGKVFRVTDKGEHRVEKPGDSLEANAALRVAEPEHPFVSRGGVKLAHALDHFRLDPRGRVAADIGVSTGGFTDCLLQRGVTRVHAVDVGYGQTAWKIRTDPRVVLHERTNARLLKPGAFGEPIELMVIDASFIRLGQLFRPLVGQLAPGARVIALVKPQFELPADEVGDGGVIRDPSGVDKALAIARAAVESAGLVLEGEVESPLRGADGNREILVSLRWPVSA